MRMIRASCFDKRGERVVTIVRQDAMDAMPPRDERRSLRTAKSCGPGAPGLALSLRDRDVGPIGPDALSFAGDGD